MSGALKLKRARDLSRSYHDAWWEVEEGRFVIHRVRDQVTLSAPDNETGCEGRYWAVGAFKLEDRRLLARHGLYRLAFPTRREVLQRLQDALQLEEPGDE